MLEGLGEESVGHRVEGHLGDERSIGGIADELLQLPRRVARRRTRAQHQRDREASALDGMPKDRTLARLQLGGHRATAAAHWELLEEDEALAQLRLLSRTSTHPRTTTHLHQRERERAHRSGEEC